MLLHNLLFLSLPVYILGLQCIGQSNAPIDHFTIYKLPKLENAAEPFLVGGLGYAYRDNNTKLYITGNTLQDGQDALTYTLSALYGANTAEIGWVTYNDEVPGGSTCTETCGHTKGALGFDASGAFYLLHTTPHFVLPPSSTSAYSFPSNEADYGQTFLCVSLPFSAIETIAAQMLYTKPEIYDSNVPASLAAQLPTLAKAISGQHITTPTANVVTMQTIGGWVFDYLVKTSTWGQDFYAGLVAPHYNVNLYIETWMRPKMASVCSPLQVLDVNALQFPGVADASFGETKDHAKWAISTSSSSPLACQSDMNHQETQYARGGGALCFFDESYYADFVQLVSNADSC